MMNSIHRFPSESHTTLVENDMGPKAKSEDTLTYNPIHTPKKSWADHILGFFYARTSIPNEKTKALETPEVGDSLSSWPSPWILPVYVISNQQDADKDSITKIAKCTIDTGNMQGNIVSRDFVENVLGFPSSSFGKLTKEEERGGTGITGEPHIPLGVIHLTWYHKNSTRVFRDMRFLISPAQHCDLIIGALSIENEKILDVPCLPAKKRPPPSVEQVVFPAHEDEDLETLKLLDADVRDAWDTSRNNRNKKRGTTEYTKLDDTYKKRESEVDVVGWLIIVCGIAIEQRNGEHTDTSEVAGIWEEIELRWQDIRPKIHDKLDPIYQKLGKEFGLKDGREAAKAMTTALG